MMKKLIENITFYSMIQDKDVSIDSLRELVSFRLKEDFNVNLRLQETDFLVKKLVMLSYAKLTELLINAVNGKNSYNTISAIIVLDTIMEEVLKEDKADRVKIANLENEFLDLIK